MSFLTVLSWALVFLLMLLPGSRGKWEVLNEVKDDIDFLEVEHFIPADEYAKQEISRSNQRNLASVKGDKSVNTDHISEMSQPRLTYSRTHANSNPNGVNQMTLQDSSTNQQKEINIRSNVILHNSLVENDNVDLTKEGFLISETKIKRRSASSRKLNQFSESSSPGDVASSDVIQQETINTNYFSDLIVNQEPPADSPKKRTFSHRRQLSDERRQQLKKQNKIIPQPVIVKEAIGDEDNLHDDFDMDSIDLSRACLDPQSWDCKMFLGDYLIMKGGSNLSSKDAVKHRAKRVSGSGTEDEDYIGKPKITCPYTSRFKTNVKSQDLTNSNKTEFAEQLRQQLVKLFANVTGFTSVEIDQGNVSIQGDQLVIEWACVLNGKGTSYKGMTVNEMVDRLRTDFNAVASSYQNIRVDNEATSEAFQVQNIINRCENVLKDPCSYDPCQVNYENCNLLNGTDSTIRCTHKCKAVTCRNYEGCEVKKGTPTCTSTCLTDCGSGDFKELIHKETDERNVDLHYDSISLFNATDMGYTDNLNDTEKTRLATLLKEALTYFFNNTAGFKYVEINPSDIRIENGTLIFPWRAIYDGNNGAFNRQTVKEILDAFNTSLKNASDTYKDLIRLGKFPPIDDFQLDKIIQQLSEQLNAPCKYNLCKEGYDNCEVLFQDQPLKITCTHKCKTSIYSNNCYHSGMCDLDENMQPFCQCTSNWQGQYCNETRSARKLDGGEITGVVVGAIVVGFGVIGCCCWFALCFRKGDSDMIYSHYTDEEGSSSYSSPNVKLGFLIDRPHVSQEPNGAYNSTPQNSDSS